MPAPKNPETIIVKNKYYPRGLTEGDVWKYYQKNKWNIIKDLNNRTVFFDIATDLNKTVIKRKGKNNKTYYINSRNFDDVMTGRTLAIHGVMSQAENFGVIDIDVDDYKWAQQATYEVYEYSKKISGVTNSYIKFTGKTSFHVVCKFGDRKRNIDVTRHNLKYNLLESPLAKKYTVEAKRRPGIPNLDLSSNKLNGGFITLYSLSTLGLPCTKIKARDIFSFRPEKVRIK